MGGTIIMGGTGQMVGTSQMGGKAPISGDKPDVLLAQRRFSARSDVSQLVLLFNIQLDIVYQLCIIISLLLP
jgi:hypothetical protein